MEIKCNLKLVQFRSLMYDHNYDAYIIPHTDNHDVKYSMIRE